MVHEVEVFYVFLRGGVVDWVVVRRWFHGMRLAAGIGLYGALDVLVGQILKDDVVFELLLGGFGLDLTVAARVNIDGVVEGLQVWLRVEDLELGLVAAVVRQSVEI